MNVTNTISSIESPAVTVGSTEQTLTFLLVLITCMVSGIVIHLLKSFWYLRNEMLYKKPLLPRRPLHLLVSYICILLSLFVQTISLMCLYWINVNKRNKFVDGTSIYFSKAVDCFLHILFWTLFLSFIHLKLYGLILQIYECDHGYDSPRYNHYSKYKNACQRFGYIFVILSIVTITSIQIAIVTPTDTHTLSSNYEQTFLLIIAIMSFIFINWYVWKHFDEETDTIYFKEQWNKIWWLFSIALIIWFIVFVISILYKNIDYLSFKLCVILLYATWIGLFCYIETKWIVNKLTKHQNQTFAKHSINISNYSNNNAIDYSKNNAIITDLILEDDKVIHDMLMDSIDTADGGDGGENNNNTDEFKVHNDKELSLIIENRKKQLQKQTKDGDEIFGIETFEEKKSEIEMKFEAKDHNSGSDSEELYDSKNKKKRKQTRKTPKPPPKVGEKWNKLKMKNPNGLMDDKSDSEDMYQNNYNMIDNQITTKGTKRKDSSSSDSDELYKNKGHNSIMSNILQAQITPNMITEKKPMNVDDNASAIIVTKQMTIEGEDDDDGAV